MAARTLAAPEWKPPVPMPLTMVPRVEDEGCGGCGGDSGGDGGDNGGSGGDGGKGGGSGGEGEKGGWRVATVMEVAVAPAETTMSSGLIPSAAASAA